MTLIRRPSTTTEPTASVRPKASASPGATRPAGMGRAAVRCHPRIDVGVVPHVQSARLARRRRCKRSAVKPTHRMHMARRDQKADKRGEHHERHHPRLHQLDVVADAPQSLGSTRAMSDAHRISGSVSY